MPLQRSGSQSMLEQRSGSQSMLELEDLSAVPEDLRRQSESGSLPVSLKALQASGKSAQHHYNRLPAILTTL